MITVNHLIEAITHEFHILKHLGSKVTEDNKSYRFSDTQRTTEEVEQYIISSFPAQVKLMVLGKRDENMYTNYTNQFSSFTFDQFSASLDRALEEISADLRGVQDAQWDEMIDIRGRKAARSAFLVDYVLVFLWAYKMQLFLQLKAAGCPVGTYNLWAGIDAPKQV